MVPGLFKLYVAMTRAKHELIISYSQGMSSFIRKCMCIDSFVQANWNEHSLNPAIPGFSLPSSSTKSYEEFYQDHKYTELTGRE